ncbi:MAG: hypothetical protein GY772_06415 [bacterium]|nr:hypothetical protein [bacterium]
MGNVLEEAAACTATLIAVDSSPQWSKVLAHHFAPGAAGVPAAAPAMPGTGAAGVPETSRSHASAEDRPMPAPGAAGVPAAAPAMPGTGAAGVPETSRRHEESSEDRPMLAAGAAGVPAAAPSPGHEEPAEDIAEQGSQTLLMVTEESAPSEGPPMPSPGFHDPSLYPEMAVQRVPQDVVEAILLVVLFLSLSLLVLLSVLCVSVIVVVIVLVLAVVVFVVALDVLGLIGVGGVVALVLFVVDTIAVAARLGVLLALC